MDADPGIDLAAVDLLSFDCYGTLIDWEAGLSAALAAWGRRRAVAEPPEDLLARFAAHEGVVQQEHPTLLYPLVLGESLRRIGADLGAEVDDDDAAAIGGSVPDWPAFPDSTEALTALARHYRLVILSNVDRTSFAASNRRLGVEFTRVITAQDVGVYKPSPRSFEALAREVAALGVPAERHVHVAQSLFHDHVPAKQAGLRTVWINRRRGREGWGATPPPPVEVVPDAEYPDMASFAAAADAASG